MADFIWTESPGTSMTLRVAAVVTQFGDGYAQRAPDGLNPVKEVWDYVASGCDEVIADEIDAFLRPKVGVEAFNYVPMRQTVAKRFVCTAFSRTVGQAVGEWDIRATFEQDFAP